MRFLSRRPSGVAVAGRPSRQRALDVLRRAAGVEALEERTMLAAQLVLTKTALPSPTVLAGGDITYTVNIRNVGTDFASNVVITDVVTTAPTAGKATVVFAFQLGIGEPAFDITGTANTVTFSIGQLNSSVGASFQVIVNVAADTPDDTIVTNVATAHSDTTTDQTAMVTTIVDRRADVQVSKVLLPIENAPAPVDANSVVAGLDARYQITISNTGPNAADNVLLSDITPALTSYVSFVQTAGPTFVRFPNPLRPEPPVGQAGTVEASIVSLPVGASATFVLTVHVASNAPDDQQVSQTALVSTTTFDTNLGNNQVTVIDEIQIQTDIIVQSSPDKSIRQIEGEFFPYTFQIYNKGPSDAQGVTFTWTTPNFQFPIPNVLRPADKLVYDRYGFFGSSFDLISGPAFQVNVPPRPPGIPRGDYTGTLQTLPAGVGSAIRFWVGTPEQQDLEQISSGGTSSPDVDTTNNTYTDKSHVYDAPLIVQTVPNIQGNATQPLDLQVMSFEDTNMWPGNNVTLPYPNPGGRYDESFDFLATVSWGDGTASAALVSTDRFGTYRVTAQHTYANPGAYPVRVLATGDGESVALGDTVALIGSAPRGGAQVGGLKFTENVTETKKVAAFARGSAPASTTFTAQITWGDGSAPTAGTLTAIGNGVFNITGTHKYVDEGTYNGSIKVTGSDGVINTFPMVVVVDDRAVVAVPINIGAQQNVPINNVAVATFTDPGGAMPTGAYAAKIDWGDGTTTSSGLITYNASTGVFTVRGSHTFTATGNFTMTVTISHGTARDTVVNPVATVTVGPPAPSVNAAPVNVIAPVGAPFTGPVARFTDPAGADPVLTNYTATIDWGDGTPATPGVITVDTAGLFTVTGTHTYAALGTYNMTVSITHLAAPGATVNPVATVINPAPSVNATPVNVTAVENVPAANVLVATFKDPNGAGALTNYTATIDWGDGTPATPGVITYNATTQTFSVRGTHTWALAGTYNMAVTIGRVGSLNRIVNPVATVTPPSSITSVTGTTITGVEGKLLQNVTVGSFVTSNTNAGTTDFAALIDWGDGTTPTTGVLVRTGNGMFAVRGSHTYKDDGRFAITVTVTPNGQGPRTIPSIANIVDAPLAGVKLSFSATKNVQFTNKVIGSFSDGNPFDLSPSEYAVTIAWGDGTANSTGTVTYNTTTKRWDIKGSHKYTKASPTGGFVMTITVKDGTQQVRINSLAIVK